MSLPVPPSAPTPKLPLLPVGESAPELDELRQFSRDVLQENMDNLRSSSGYIRRSLKTLYIMYLILFGIGSATAAAAIVKGLFAQSPAEATGTLAFAGLSAASFFALFLTRPLEALERTSLYSAWLTAATNTYWTRLMYFSNVETIDRDLTAATDELVRNLALLGEKYGMARGRSPAAAPTQPGAPGSDANPRPSPPTG